MEVGNLWLIPFSVLFNSSLYFLQKHYLIKWFCRRFLTETVVLECDLNDKKTLSNGTTKTTNGVVQANGVTNQHSKKKIVTDGEIASVAMENVGSLIAAVTALVAAIVMFETRRDILHARSSILIPWCHIAAWYFVVDLYDMYDSHILKKNLTAKPLRVKLSHYLKAKKQFIMHHVVLFIFGYTIVVNDHWRSFKGDFVVASIIGEDLSNPLVNSAKVLKMLGQERTLCYKVNGYLLLVTFFVVRLLNIPFDVIVYAAQYHGWNIFQALLKLHLTCYVSIIIMYIMQIYWFSMIFKLAMKGLRDMREREREEAEKKAKSD